MNRFLKQLIYLGFFCLILSLILGLIFFPKFKRKEKSLTQFKNIEINWVKFARVGSDKITILSSILNPNPGFTGKFRYQMNAYNPYGTVVAKIDKSSFIYGGQKKYLIEPAVDIGEEDVSRVNLVVQKVSFIKEKNPSPRLKIISSQVEKREGNFFLEGEIENENNLPVSSIKIIAFILENNYLKLASSTYIQKLEGRKKTAFEIYLPNFNLSLSRLPMKIWAEGEPYAF